MERKSDASSWKGEFSAKYVEDITAKTGNFKKFPVFVKMLASAVRRQVCAHNADFPLVFFTFL